MLQPSDELSITDVEKAKRFVNLQQGRNADKGRATKMLLEWIEQAQIDEAETALNSITDAPFAQPSEDPESDDYSDTNWISVLREMEERGLGKLILGRHGWPTRFAWKNASSLRTACLVLERPLPESTGGQRAGGSTTRGSIPPTRLYVGRIEIRLPLGGASEEEWAELVRWIARRGGRAPPCQ